MNESVFFSERIQEINKEMGVSIAAGFLEDVQNHFSDLSNSDLLDVDIFLAENARGAVKRMIQSWQEQNSNIVGHIVKINEAKSLQSPSSCVAVCCLDEELNENPIIPNLIASQEHYKLVLIIDFLEQPDAAQQFARLLGFRVKSKILPGAEAENKPFVTLIEETVGLPQVPTLKTLGRLNRVKPVLTILNQVFQSENKIAQTRKLLNSQDQLITRKEEQGFNNMDLANNIRQAIQKFSSDMDKTFRLKYDDLNKPVTGAFAKTTNQLAQQITDFKRESIAEKDERVEIKFVDEYNDQFLGTVRKTVGDELKKDSAFLSVSLNELISRINTLLAGKNVGAISVQMDVVDFPDYKKSIVPYNQFNRPYKSELIKKGMMEYFVALRDYTGVIMVATGLLAPLSIVANISENGFLKHLSNGIKFSMAGIAMILIVYGIYDLKTRIPKKRREEFLKELEKAREFVQNEGKRMFSEISRDWITVTSNWVRDIAQAVANAFEKKIKETQQNKLNNVNQDKIQQQRRQQSLDAYQRGIANAERIKEAMATRFRDLYMETEKKITF